MRDELGVFVHERVARRAEIELARMIAEKFAVHARPDEAAVGVDVDLGHAELGGGQVFVFIDAARAGVERAAGRVDAADLFLRHAAAAVHDDGRAGDFFLDGADHVEVQALLALELVRAVAGADGGGERVAPGLVDEFDGLVRVGQAGVAFVHLDVFLHAAELAEFGLDADALGVGALDDALGDGDVFVEIVVAGVDHDRRIKAAVDAVVAGFLVAVVEMDGEDRLGENDLRRADDGFEHALVGVFARALGKLDDEGRLASRQPRNRPMVCSRLLML